MNKLLIVVIDGCATDYISRSNTPNLYRMAKSGFCKSVKSAIPAVSNVNHTTILTGEFPKLHEVFSVPEFGQCVEPLKIDTLFDLYHRRKKSTALLTIGSEMLNVFGRGAKFSICVEKPNEILNRFIGMEAPPEPKSLDANLWILEAAHNLIKKNNPDLVYCTTNDYLMKNYGPETPEACTYMQKVDGWLGKIYDLDIHREMYITSDHGNKKNAEIIHFENLMDETLLNDALLGVNCFEEGGMLFLDLADKTEKKLEGIVRLLEKNKFVDQVLPRKAAAEKLNLPCDKIGDLTVLPKDKYVFGHAFENEIPLVAVNPREVPQKYRYSRDIVKIIKDKMEGDDQ